LGAQAQLERAGLRRRGGGSSGPGGGLPCAQTSRAASTRGRGKGTCGRGSFEGPSGPTCPAAAKGQISDSVASLLLPSFVTSLADTHARRPARRCTKTTGERRTRLETARVGTSRTAGASTSRNACRRCRHRMAESGKQLDTGLRHAVGRTRHDMAEWRSGSVRSSCVEPGHAAVEQRFFSTRAACTFTEEGSEVPGAAVFGSVLAALATPS